MWKIRYYSEAVREEIFSLPVRTFAKYEQIIERLEQYGPGIQRMPHMRQLEGELWEIRAIAGMMLGQVASRLKERAIALTWDDEVVEKLAREGYDVKFGARPLRRLIQRTVEDTLSEELLGGKIALGDRVRLKVTDGKITVEKEA